MKSNKEESLYSPILRDGDLEMSPDSKPPEETKKRAWPRRLQIPLGLLIVGLVGVSTMCTLSFADSKDGDGDNQERDRRNVRSGFGGKRRVPKTNPWKCLALCQNWGGVEVGVVLCNL